jgi:hypothetical protein
MDLSKLSDDQLLELKSSGGDLRKLSDATLMALKSSIPPQRTRTDVDGYEIPDNYEAPKAPFLQRAGRYARGVIDEAANLGTGLSDELGAAADATIPTQFLYPTSQADSWSQRYQENLKGERGRMQQFREENPASATAANIGGSVVGAMNLPKALYSGAGLGMNMLKGGASGAILGGGQAFGEGEGGFGQRMEGVPMGMLIGGGLGAAAPVLGAGVGYATEKFAPSILRTVAKGADAVTPTVKPTSLSAAAPDGGMPVAKDSLAATIADSARNQASKIEGDAAMKRLALEISRSGGVGKAQAALDDAGEGAFLAGTSKGTTRLANVGNMLPGEAADKYAAAYTARNAETGQRFLNAMGEHADAPGVSRFDKFFEGYRSGKGAEIYDPVLRTGKLNVSDDMLRLMRQKQSLRDAMELIEGTNTAETLRMTQAEKAHLIKRALNDMEESALDKAGKPVDKTALRAAARQWEEALYKANPKIQAADEAYAKIASLPEWRDRGLNFMKKGYGEDAVKASADALADELPKATAQQAIAAQVGTSNVMADAAKAGAKSTRRLADALTENSTLKAKLAEIYKDDPAMVEQILKQSGTELKFAKEAQDVLGGSHTGQRVASLSDELGLSISPSTSPASLVQMLVQGYQKVRQPNEAVRSQLADLLANSDRATNAETLRLVEAMLRQPSRARPFSAAIAGTSGGSSTPSNR